MKHLLIAQVWHVVLQEVFEYIGLDLLTTWHATRLHMRSDFLASVCSSGSSGPGQAVVLQHLQSYRKCNASASHAVSILQLPDQFPVAVLHDKQDAWPSTSCTGEKVSLQRRHGVARN